MENVADRDTRMWEFRGQRSWSSEVRRAFTAAGAQCELSKGGVWTQTGEVEAALRKAAPCPQPSGEEQHVPRPPCGMGWRSPQGGPKWGSRCLLAGNMGCSRTRQCLRSPAVGMDSG